MTLKEAKTHWNEGLSESEREEISSLYDDKSIKLDDIVKKYNLPFDKSKLPELVLPRQTDETCKWCGEKLYMKRRRTAMYAKNSAFCIKCGHVNDISCACDRCVDYRERQKEQERAAEEQRRQEKSRRIIEKYGKKTPPIDFNSLTLIEKVIIGIILTHTAGKTEFALEDYDSNMFPAKKDGEILIQMLKKSILVISDNVNPDAFSDDLRFYSIKKLRLKLNIINSNEEVERLIEGNFNLSEQDFRYLWRYIAQLQLIEYLIYKMDKVDFAFSPGIKTVTMINEMLEHFSVSQGMRLIYGALNKACRRYQEGGINRKHAANSVITICRNYTRRALEESWKVSGFERDYEIEISTAENYICSVVLGIGEDGFRSSPGKMSKEIYRELYSDEFNKVEMKN